MCLPNWSRQSVPRSQSCGPSLVAQSHTELSQSITVWHALVVLQLCRSLISRVLRILLSELSQAEPDCNINSSGLRAIRGDDAQRGCSNDVWFLNGNGVAGMWVGTQELDDGQALTSSVRECSRSDYTIYLLLHPTLE
jgi:hypothetical protein